MKWQDVVALVGKAARLGALLEELVGALADDHPAKPAASKSLSLLRELEEGFKDARSSDDLPPRDDENLRI